MDRRHFIRRVGLWVASLTGAVAAVAYLRRFFPPATGEKRGILLGDPRQYPVDTYTFIAEHSLFIYRDHEGIKAVSAVCTHLGCILERSTDGFQCPCHGSCYNDAGEVLSGPAPVNLSWYRVAATADGKIYVDPGRQADAGDKFLTT